MHVLLTWNKSVFAKQTRQEKNNQETNNQNNDLFKVAANALGLHKQNNTNGTCAADVKQIIIWLENNTVNKITKIMTPSKSTASASGPMVYTDDTRQVIM